jgi:hypothetical protein
MSGSGWIKTLTEAKIKISMDGRGRYLDNIFIERLWWSLKQKATYLHEITDGFQAKQIIDDLVGFTILSALTSPLIYGHRKSNTSHTRQIRKAA